MIVIYHSIIFKLTLWKIQFFVTIMKILHITTDEKYISKYMSFLHNHGNINYHQNYVQA